MEQKHGNLFHLVTLVLTNLSRPCFIFPSLCFSPGFPLSRFPFPFSIFRL